MLEDFLVTHRNAILANARARVASRESPHPTESELSNGIPVFLHQLGAALRLASSGGPTDHKQIDLSAGRHGLDLFRMGLTIGQVVHDYGDVCQAITEVAVQSDATVTGAEFKTLNLCLDDAIAGAVEAYSGQQELRVREESTERLGVFAHEMRSLVNAGMLAYESIRSGRVAVSGSTGGLLGRSLFAMQQLIDRSLAHVRLEAGIQRTESISVAEFVAELQIGFHLQAETRGLRLVVASVEQTVTIEGDRSILLAAVANLLQNAFKFSHQGGTVALTTRVTSDLVCLDVEDECGGLPPGKVEDLFRPFTQRAGDRSGVGLGLSICLQAAKANGGELRVRDLPGKGCVFTLELPRKPTPPLKMLEWGPRQTPVACPVAAKNRVSSKPWGPGSKLHSPTRSKTAK